jgi:hypothetical protein
MKIEVFHVACQVHIRHGHIQAVLIRQIFIRGRFDMPAQFINDSLLKLLLIHQVAGFDVPEFFGLLLDNVDFCSVRCRQGE